MKKIINALVQKASEFDDLHLQNPAVVQMLLEKEIEFDNYEKIEDFLNFLKDAKQSAQKSR